MISGTTLPAPISCAGSEEGKDVHAMLPYLMRYMGHASLESTYYYIHLIPDYFPQYSALSASTEAMIPEVEDDEV